ncbi:hypothetical protein ARMSODRAFT_888221 [Armillaria solidipes]|uniref:Uncharacterized protein n=1 Tax=Armillaria solidipes TaxID=1076256 RepID=A0A2H3BB23_9AGAR|nr:hypothetical protein ARMSODRAFT_888221 [Armillaria solidipes]
MAFGFSPWRFRALLGLSIFALFLFALYNFAVFRGSSAVTHDPASNTSNSTSLPKVLLVSAFYPISTSNYRASEYRQWLSVFLGQVTTEIYLFTSPGMEEIVWDLRGSRPITVNTTYTSPFSIPPLRGRVDKYVEMQGLDRRPGDHSAELYAMRNGKPFFVYEAMRNLSAEYDYAFWIDVGSWETDYGNIAWPDVMTTQEVLATGQEVRDRIFFPIHALPHTTMKYWGDQLGPIDNDFSQSSFFGGSLQALDWWQRMFYRYHDAYLSQGVFVGDDQTLANALFLLFPSHVLTVDLDVCESYQYLLASPSDRQRMYNARNTWDWWGFWNDKHARQSCLTPRAAKMMDVLKARFGQGWTPPRATLVS